MNNSGEVNRLSGTPNFKPALPPPRTGSSNFRGRGVGIGAPSSDRPVLPAPNLPPRPPAKPLPTSTVQAPNKPMEQPPSPPKPVPQVPPFRNCNNQNQNSASESTVIIIPNKPSIQPAVNTAEIITEAEKLIDQAASVGFKNQELALDLLDKAGDLYLQAASSEDQNQFDYLKMAACLYAIAQDYLTYLGRTISKEFEVLERKRYPTMSKVRQLFDQDWGYESNSELTSLRKRVWLVDTTKIKKESKFSKIGTQLKKNSSSLLKGASKKIDSVSKAAQKNLSAAFAAPLSIDQKVTQLENNAKQAEQEGRLAEAFHLRHQIAELYAEHKGMLDESNPSITICLSRSITWFESLIPQIRHLSVQEQENMRALISQQTERARAELKTRPDIVYDKKYLEEEVKKSHENAQMLAAKVASNGTLLDEMCVNRFVDCYNMLFDASQHIEQLHQKYLSLSFPNNSFFNTWKRKEDSERRDYPDYPKVTLTPDGRIPLNHPAPNLDHLITAANKQSLDEIFTQLLAIKQKVLTHPSDSGKHTLQYVEYRYLLEAQSSTHYAERCCYVAEAGRLIELALRPETAKKYCCKVIFSGEKRRIENVIFYYEFAERLAHYLPLSFQNVYLPLFAQALKNAHEASKVLDIHREAYKSAKAKKEQELRDQQQRNQTTINMADVYRACTPQPMQYYCGNSVYGFANGGMGGFR